MTPLAGLRIVDLSMFVAGPFGTAILAGLGAEGGTEEPPGGDPVRSAPIGPRIGDAAGQFHTYNHSKRSVVADLKTDDGKETVRTLAAGAHAVFDNFRPGVMARLGLDHATLATRNPRLVAVSLSGFGARGPWARRPGYDLIVQALGGGLSLCGHPGTGPAHIPFHLGDTAGGLYAAIALLAAVREAEQTGQGRAYEVSMLDAQLHLAGDEITFAGTGTWPGAPHGAGHPALAPYSVFPTADAPVAIAAVGTEKFWHALLAALDLPGLADDPRFADNGARAANRDALHAALEARLVTEGADHWLARFDAADVPAAPVLGIGAAASSAHAVARGLVQNLAAGLGAPAALPSLPIRALGDDRPLPMRPAPALDADRAALQDGGGDA